MAQQYSYGYGYGYAQPAAGYGVQMPGYGAAAAARPPQQASYQVAPYAPKAPATATPQPPQAASQAQTGYYQAQVVASAAATVAPVVSAQPSAAPLPQQTQPAASYYGYQQYRPPAPQQATASFATYYQQPAAATSKATPTASHQGVGYGSSPAVAMPSVAYPNTYSSPYYSANNRFGTYNSTTKNPASKPASVSAAPSYTPSSASFSNASSYTSAQEKVIANYIAQKTTGPAATAGTKFGGKKYNPNNQAVYFCDICKISCASSMTYKTHLEGKAHKKKVNSQQATNGKQAEAAEGGGEVAVNKPHYCPLCEVQCTSKDSYEAHIRGTRHTKVLNLYRRLGKPIPDIKLPAGSEITTTVGGKKLSVTAPRINFVGGQQLTSTGAAESSGPPKLYPPGGPTVTVPDGGGTEAKKEENHGGEDNPDITHEIEPVGEQFVIAVSNDPKFPHATFKCTMCDCYFNDEWARKAHAKGRRHRLNYKKLYQPDLYVEPSKSNRKKAEQIRVQRKIEEAARGRGRGGGVRGGGGVVRGGGGGGRGGGGHQALVADVESLRRQEAEELSKLQSKNNPPVQEMETEFFVDVPPPPPLPHLPQTPHFEVEPPSHFYPSRPRNPRDDRLVMNKHGSICPVDSEIKAVQQAVADVEGILKSISDDILDETCKQMSEEQGKEVGRDEKLRKLKGVMRVGAFARSLMLRGECSVDLVLMCTGRPTVAFFSDVARRMPAKFEELSSELVYNVNQDASRAAILVISQVEDHRVQVTLTLTSTEMRNTPPPEQSQADEEAGVLHRPSCNAALAALRHTKWFQMVAQGLPSCGILMRVLKDICRRVPAWGVLDSWILELLVQKCLTSANPDYTRPGDAFRRVMECVASGIFLPGGSGLQDPCEKGLVDASACLSAQERVNITLSAQHALRLIAFGKIHLVLGVDPLPPPGSRREPPGEDKTSDKAGESKDLEAAEPETKKVRVADSKE